MIFKKTMETYLDIIDPFQIYSTNADETFLKKLEDKFVGVCVKSCYVLSINKLLRRSYTYMNDTLKGGATVCVLFEAGVIVYNHGEVITDCHIIKKETRGIIHAKSEYAGIQLTISPDISIFSQGDIVPVRVNKVRYNVNQNSISILAIPFLPMKLPKYKYLINKELDDDEIKKLKIHIDDIITYSRTIKQYTAQQKKVYEFFVNLIHEKHSLKLKTSEKKYNISNMTSIKKGAVYKIDSRSDDFIVVDSNVDDSTLKTIDNQKNATGEFVVSETAYNVLYNIAMERLSDLQMLCNFVKQYPTFDAVQKNKSVWKLYMIKRN